MQIETESLDNNGMFSYVKNEQLEYVLSFKFCSFTRKDASEVNSYFNEDFVTQHEILRELAMHQSSQEPIEKRFRLIKKLLESLIVSSLI